MEKTDFLIVGAGLTGAVCARELLDKGFSVTVVDKRPVIGGNCYTENNDGILVHKYGPHIFHTSDREIWDFVNKFAEFIPYQNCPIMKYEDQVYNLPFNMNTFAKIFGVTTPEEAKIILDSEISKANIKTPTNLEEQALSLVGKTIYEIFIKGYTEKQWGRDCKDLPPEIIKRLPVRFTFDNNYFNDTYQGIPKNGYTEWITKMLKGAKIKLGVDYLENKNEFKADKIIYTGSIDEYYKYKLGKLDYRSLRFEDSRLNISNYQGNAVVNYGERDISWTRITEHKHFDRFCKSSDTIISREYPGLYDGTNERYYPINDEKNNKLYRDYENLASSDNIYFAGRLGQYKYYDMDKCIIEAREVVSKILKDL